MKGSRYLLPAEEELTESAIFYEDKSEGLGTNFLDEIENSVARICKYPELGQKHSENLRRFVLARFPYSLIYGIEKDTIVVVSVAHQRREPGFWKNR